MVGGAEDMIFIRICVCIVVVLATYGVTFFLGVVVCDFDAESEDWCLPSWVYSSTIAGFMIFWILILKGVI